MDQYISLLLKEPHVDKVVTLLEQDDSWISDMRFEALPSFWDGEGLYIVWTLRGRFIKSDNKHVKKN
ncbi:hypothetical protein [Parabacteroides sp.]|uniref:hypothetical protein n=1 Tax=Parabacteroides sp. TaxID=1869337 RepID=UPI0026DF57FA|nr:hypothetical protein [Parabacteroides sp.]MDO5430726.1 hypothetical protein [Parabacteroides sp.]